MAEKIRMVQYGTRHGHAKGVLGVMMAHPEVEIAGVYEPDTERQNLLANSGDETWSSVHWFNDSSEFLDDPDIVAVASEGANKESLAFTEEIIAAGKHAFYDKPAGDDYARFERVVERARRTGLFLQMGYMFRNHDGFERIANWARSGFLGHIFQIRAHMSTWIPETNPENYVLGREGVGHHRGGILYDLGGHMLDQIVWILGRPNGVTPFMQNAASESRDFMDNTLAVLEYPRALVTVDIAAMETRPMARRFEVYGTEGSAIMEPFEPADKIRLCLNETRGGHPAGESWIEIEDRPRYVESFARFVKNVKGETKPDRTLDHELLVQETLMRCTGSLAG